MALSDNLSSVWKLASNSDELGGITLTENGSSFTYATGKDGNGADLELANSNYLSRADGAVEPSGSFSFSCWVKMESLPSNGLDTGIIAKWNGGGANNRQYIIGSYNNGGVHQLFALLSGDGSGSIGSFFNSGMSTGTWYHVAFIFTASTSLEVYVNNSRLMNTTASVPAAAFNGNGQFMLGNFSNSTTIHDGMIDEVYYWTRAITSTEVGELYNSGTGTFYPFAAASGTNEELNGKRHGAPNIFYRKPEVRRL